MDTTNRSTGDSLNLEQLKKLAKELLGAARNDDPAAVERVLAHSHRLRDLPRERVAPSVKLHDAQFALAQEHGFTSWPRMKERIEDLARDRQARIEDLARDRQARIDALIEASLAPRGGMSHRMGDLKRVQRLLEFDPSLATATIATACVLGDVDSVDRMLARDAALAKAPTGPRSWTPLLHVCFSRILRIEPARTSDFVAIATRLLDAGADANEYWTDRNGAHGNETALYGAAGVAHCGEITELLLARGADPDDRVPESVIGSESLYHACEADDLRGLRAILEAKPRPAAVSYCLARKLDFEDVDGARLMIEHGADVNFKTPFGDGDGRLHHAIRRGRGIAILQVLVDAGADLSAHNAHGQTPYALASRLGRADVAAWLLEQGATDDLDARARFIAAASRGDCAAARALLGSSPGLIESLDAEDQKVLPWVAGRGDLATVTAMLDLGFPIDAKGDPVGNAIHTAAWEGHPEVVELLIQRGANLDLLNDYQGTPLGAAVWAAAYGPPVDDTTRERIVRALARAMQDKGLDADISGHLRGAVINGTPNLARLMLELGADLDARRKPEMPSARELIEGSDNPELLALI